MTTRGDPARAGALVVAIACAACVPVAAARAARAGHAQAVRRPSSASAPRAPGGPPLAAAGAYQATEESSGATPSSQLDPLVANGLGSPLCHASLAAGELPQQSRRDCGTSGFIAAPAPTGNYGIDVHIDTGPLGFNFSSVVQDVFVTPVWTALVWGVHATVVMVEWCFTIDLLDGPAAGGVGGALRHMQETLTEPWLATVLAAASVLALYNGLIRRRIAQTLGEAVLMLAMMAGGLWIIADPAGTIGAIARWANEASLGALAVAATGSPAQPGATLAQAMDTVFAAGIEAPWCYMEFGDVSWCRDPSRLEPQLRSAGLKLAGAQAPQSTPGAARAVQQSAQLAREAQTNGAVFLAFPANGPARNSINQPGSLLRVLCGDDEATNCGAATAAQAEFRTGGATWSRVGGLILIALGLLGLLLLLAFLGSRLLAAAIFVLLYLLLTPAIVLAPALGEAGRALFRRWLARLLAAALAKLLFSFLLGAVLAVLAILASLRGVGWWAQWLLMSAFWWGAFARRHQALGIAEGALGREPRAERPAAPRRPRTAIELPRAAVAAARRKRERKRREAPGELDERAARARMMHAREGASAGGRASRPAGSTARGAIGDARARGSAARSAKRARLERIERERARAERAGDARRTARLRERGERLRAELGAEGGPVGPEAAAAELRSGHASRADPQRAQSARADPRHGLFLRRQAELPSALEAARRAARGERGVPRRDYAALAPVLGAEHYEKLDPPRRRAIRLEVDRALALHRHVGAAALGADPAVRAAGDGAEAAVRGAEAPVAGGSRLRRARDVARESSVMRDAREVEAKRKRQLGRDRA